VSKLRLVVSVRQAIEKRCDYQADVGVGESQILSSRRRRSAILKHCQADDVTSHKRLSYLERVCFAVPYFRSLRRRQ